MTNEPTPAESLADDLTIADCRRLLRNLDSRVCRLRKAGGQGEDLMIAETLRAGLRNGLADLRAKEA